jgi:hypothetical protein
MTFEFASIKVKCVEHGTMQFSFAADWWTCAGFDGEGCTAKLTMEEAVLEGPVGNTYAQDWYVHPEPCDLGVRWHYETVGLDGTAISKSKYE